MFVVCRMGLDKCIMTRFHHYGIIWSIFTAIKFIWVPPIHQVLVKIWGDGNPHTLLVGVLNGAAAGGFSKSET